MARHGTVRRAARTAATTAGAILLLPLLLAAAAPPWNGTADQPAATGYPTPETTGVPAGTTLTDYTGPCTITTAGTVIDARRVLCEDLDVNAPGVIIRSSEVHGEIRHSVAGEPLQVVDSTLGPPTGCDSGSAISEAHYTATRLEVRNVGDGFRYSGDNITVQDSYVKICDEAGQNEEWHADGMQGYFGGENAVVHHNTVDMPEEGGVTSPVFWADYSAGGLQLTDNLLMGGGYVIRVYHYGGARHVVSGNRVVNNRWGYGPADSDCAQIDWTGNTLVTIDDDYNVTSTVGALDCTGDEPPSAQAVPARTVKVMTWNACGNNSACEYYEDPNGLIGTVRWHMLNHGTPMNAAIIQEFCSSFAKPLEYQLEDHYGFGWDVRFAPIKIKQGNDPAAAPNKQCVRGRGDYGIALAVPDENTWWEARYLPSADGAEWRVAMCATVESWLVKICNAHFSYNGDDPTGGFRTQQVTAYQNYVWPSRYRVIFGGDLNLTPPGTETSGGLVPLYNAFVECAQAGQSSPRTGPGTYYTSTPHDNARTVKVDYLFTNPGIPHTCGLPGPVVESSDHRPMWITVNLPAT